MPDEMPEIEPIHLTQHVVFRVERWPQRTSFSQPMLDSPHVYGMIVEGETVRFDIFNGEAVYRLTGETGPMGTRVAELVEGSDKVTARKVQRA
jgi:hypothetical protein